MQRLKWVGVVAVTAMAIILVREVRQREPAAAAQPRVEATSRGEGAPVSGAATAARRTSPVVPVAPPRTDAPNDQAEVRSADGAPGPEEVRNHLETAFGSEHATASSQARTYSVEKGVRAALPAKSSVRAIECRGALCRIETEHSNMEEFHEFIRNAFQTPDSSIANAPVFAGPLASATSGSTLVAVAYLGSEGAMLPMPPSVNARPES